MMMKVHEIVVLEMNKIIVHGELKSEGKRSGYSVLSSVLIIPSIFGPH